MKSKNQTKKTIPERIIEILGLLFFLVIVYFALVYKNIQIKEEKENPKKEYRTSFVDSLIIENSKIEFLEKDSAFIQWSNPAIRYAFRKWFKLNPYKNKWNKK